MRIAVPTSAPGGLSAPLSPHFGHCEVFTLVDVDDGQVSRVESLQNVPHTQGGCMGPVMLLKQAGVDVLVAGGMGMRPLMGFEQVGIAVYYAGTSSTVAEAVEQLVAGQLPRFDSSYTCGGSHAHHG